MAAPVMPGAEPQSWSGSRHGVLVLHGFTSTPQSMRPLAAALAGCGYSVELPLLAGHGTSVADMLETTWTDWLTSAEAAYADLAARCERVVVAGLSMGGSLSIALGEAHPELAGLVLVNPQLLDPDPAIAGLVEQMVSDGATTTDAIGGDIKASGSVELAYDQTPLPCALSLFSAMPGLRDAIARITMPVLLLSSREDHLVPPETGEWLATHLAHVERVMLEDSFHVATLDNDAPRIASAAAEFCARVFA